MSRDEADCGEALALLADWLKQELTPEHAARVRAHFERCRPCFDHAEFERRFLSELEAAGRGERCPDRLREALRREIRGEPPA
jgi:anti-sigma factor (TIGR02949 family)